MAPAPGTTQLLTDAERERFEKFVDGLEPLGFGSNPSNPNTPEGACRLRTASYPERKIPLGPGSKRPFKAADGMRPADGYMIDSKQVDDEKDCWRKPETLSNLADTYCKDGTKRWSKRRFQGPGRGRCDQRLVSSKGTGG